MSEDRAREFIERVWSDASLRTRVEGLSGGDSLTELIGIAAELGCVFSEADYRAAVVTFAGDALTEEAIEALAREMGAMDE